MIAATRFVCISDEFSSMEKELNENSKRLNSMTW